MHAHDRLLPDWFHRIKTRQITLPRFQRGIAWSRQQTSDLLTTVLRSLPSGATLILEVGDKEKFPSRTMANAPETGSKVNEQLLDGQQRLTAIWQSLGDYYPDRTYLVGFKNDPNQDNSHQDNPDKRIPYVSAQARWTNRKGDRYPLWVDTPLDCWERGFIPLRLLQPEDIQETIDEWIERAIPKNSNDRHNQYRKINHTISNLRTKVREFNLPYLSLPFDTPRAVALDVFIKLNTSSVRLTPYDIVVARVENETSKSLREYEGEILKSVPRAKEYAYIQNLILDITALRQNRVASISGYKDLDYEQMMGDWEILTGGIKGMVQFLEDEYIFDSLRLPSYSPIPVIAALWEHLPTHPDQRGNALNLLCRYLWRAFLTSRYEQSSTTNAFQDYKWMKAVITNSGTEAQVPIFNNERYPLPVAEKIKRADWPKRKTILGRALLAVQLRYGAEDLADGNKATVNSITSSDQPREYHHLFPDSLLKRDAQIPSKDIFVACNCALITWRTNRVISDKDPIEYLKERSKNSNLGEDALRNRLHSHLIPHKPLNVGNYDHIDNPEERRARICSDYDTFISERARLLEQVVAAVAEGQKLEIAALFHDDQVLTS